MVKSAARYLFLGYLLASSYIFILDFSLTIVVVDSMRGATGSYRVKIGECVDYRGAERRVLEVD